MNRVRRRGPFSRLRGAAGKAGIPIIPLNETLPQGLTLQAWLLGEERMLAAALTKR